MKRWSYFGLSAFAAVFVWSCKDALDTSDYDVKKITANTSLVLPLASGDLVVKDLLANAATEYVKVDKDGLVYLEYKTVLSSEGIGSKFNFPDYTFEQTDVAIIPNAVTLPRRDAEFPFFSLDASGNFGFRDEKLTEIKFKNTEITLAVNYPPNSQASEIFDVEFALPNFKKANESDPLKMRVVRGSSSATFKLKDYVARLNNNSFPIKITFIERDHPEKRIDATSATVSVKFSRIDFQYIKGFFGTKDVASGLGQDILVNAFNKSLDAPNTTVSFAAPEISLTLSNDFGIPTTISLTSFVAKKDNGSVFPMETNKRYPFLIGQPAELGQSASTKIDVTNAEEAMKFAPNKFSYVFSAKVNEGLASGENFCADTSKVRVNFYVKVPLYGQAKNIVMQETFDIDLSDVKDTEVENCFIRTIVSNELPLGATLQLSVESSGGEIVDLFTTAESIVEPSKVNTDGELVAARPTDIKSIIPNEKLKALFAGKKIIAKVVMNTANDDAGNAMNVKFKSTYKMKVKFSLHAKLKLKVDL